MDDHTARSQFSFWQRFIRIGLFAGILWSMRDKLSILFQELLNLYRNHMPLSDRSADVGKFAIEAGVFLFITYLVFIFWFAQFILPVVSLEQRIKAAWRLFLYSVSWGRLHGPAIFVRNGKIADASAELDKLKPGVAFVDLRSAITIDHLRGKDIEETDEPQAVHFMPFSKKGYSARIRVAGPGLTFTRKNEKITGFIDLRNQSRARKDVFADTRDGIRVKTNVSCAFTVGQPPDVLDIWLGGVNSDQVVVIEWENPNAEALTIKKIVTNELAVEDEKEIWEFAHNNPDPASFQSDVPAVQFPFTFDANRVRDAIYTAAHLNDPAGDPDTNQSKMWTAWTQDVTAEKFRLLLSKQPYMNLYVPGKQEPDPNPMKLFKRELFVQVRNTGVLAYRLVKHRNGGILEAGKTYQKQDLLIYPARNLTRSDILRDRGIKVLSVGFSELEPIDKDIRKRLTDAWLSAKNREAAIKFADYNLEATRIKNHARVRTQQNMIYHLTQLLENQEYPREALAMLIYQELEAAAANPETRRLLPEQTLNLITGIGEWLLPHPKNDKPDEPPSLHLENNH